MITAEAELKVDTGFEIFVIYNGVQKSLREHVHNTIKTVLERAIREFGNLPNPHTLSLFNASGTELVDSLTVKEAGIHPHDTLLLRPSQVKGGAS